MIEADKLASMVSAIYLHKTAQESGLVTNAEELAAWNVLVEEVAEIVESGAIPYFGDWNG